MKLDFFRRLSLEQKLIAALFVIAISVTVVKAVLPQSFMAAILPPGWEAPFSEVEEFYPTLQEGNAVDQIKNIFWSNMVPLFRYLMIGVSIIYFTLFMIQMSTSAGNEESIKAAQTNMLWAFMGFLVIGISTDFAEAFDPLRNNGAFVNEQVLENSQYRMISYIQMLASIIAIFYIFFAGFRMITSAGEEETITNQKNHIKWGFGGLIAIMLSDPIINRIFYPNKGQAGLGEDEIRVLVSEGVGTLNFFLTFTGILATIALIVSGVMYIVSGADDGMREKAKTNLVTSLVAIVIILVSYVIVASVLPPGAPQI